MAGGGCLEVQDILLRSEISIVFTPRRTSLLLSLLLTTVAIAWESLLPVSEYHNIASLGLLFQTTAEAL